MTSQTIPVSHNELLRSLIEGDYPKIKPVKPPRSSKKVKFIKEVQTNDDYRIKENRLEFFFVSKKFFETCKVSHLKINPFFT